MASQALNVDALVTRLSHAPARAVVEVLPDLRGRPGVIAALRSKLAPSRRRTLEKWLSRAIIRPHPATLEAFFEQATLAAQQLDPDFPALRVEDLKQSSSWYAGNLRTLDTRVDGRGWVADIDAGDPGSAEAIPFVRREAIAVGDGWAIRIASGLETAWMEAVDPKGDYANGNLRWV